MKGNEKILQELNRMLAAELTAIDQYFVHARMYYDWGFTKLYEHNHHEMEEEIQHAGALIKRILFLEGTPNLETRQPLKVGKDVPEMLNNDLQLEYQVIAGLRGVIASCEEARDYVTRDLLESMLDDSEEDHAYWLETQIALIDRVGIQNYLQSQM